MPVIRRVTISMQEMVAQSNVLLLNLKSQLPLENIDEQMVLQVAHHFVKYFIILAKSVCISISFTWRKLYLKIVVSTY
jgi:hypothetical protein